MVQHASLHSVDLSQMYVWSEFEVSISCGYLETKLNSIGKYFLFRTNANAYIRAHTRRGLHKHYFASKSRLNDSVTVACSLLFYVRGKHLRSYRDGQLT